MILYIFIFLVLIYIIKKYLSQPTICGILESYYTNYYLHLKNYKNNRIFEQVYEMNTSPPEKGNVIKCHCENASLIYFIYLQFL